MTNLTESSFKEKTLPHLDALWNTALWFAENDLGAEKLVEDAYVEAYRKWDDSVALTSSRTWMFKFLVRLILERSKMASRISIPSGFDDALKYILPNDTVLIKAIPKEIVAETIKNLPIAIRLMIVLSIFEKFTYSQIAESTGIKKDIVSAKIYQGYALIRKEIFNYTVTQSAGLQPC
jgi:RNA polymerase sigma-70 factor, ECF subfamily